MKFRFLESKSSNKLTDKEIRKALKNSGVKLPESYKLTEANSLDDNTFQAFITNLGKYNEGELMGEWFTFPMSDKDFNLALENIGIGSKDEFGQPYEEWFVTDYNCDVDAYSILGEHPSLEKLNEFGKLITDDAFKAILEDQMDFDSAKDIYESNSYIFYPGITDITDFAYQFVEDTGGVEQFSSDTLEQYFDYDALGRDLSFDSYEDDEGNELSAGEYWCGDENASDYDIGYAYVDDVGIDGVSGADSYFDYESFGRDLSFDGYTVTDYGVLYIE